MPEWLKAVFVIVFLGGWLVTVAATLIKGNLPDATLLGVPAAVVIALAPPVTIGRNRGNDTGTGEGPGDRAEQNS